MPNGETAFSFSNPPRDAITFWGHACCYIDIAGVGIITDPVFDDSYSLFHRRLIPSPPPSAYAETDIILISHAHRDHLSPKTLAAFPKKATILCPAPSAEYLSDLDMHVRVLRPGQSFVFQDLTIVAVPAYHPGGRNSLRARADGRALGFIIQTGRITLYYSGDTGYFDGLRTIGRTYRPDLALLNINGHLNSTDALRAFYALDASRVIPMHFGAYSSPRGDRSPRWCGELEDILGSMFTRLAIGDSFRLPAFHRDQDSVSSRQAGFFNRFPLFYISLPPGVLLAR